MGAGTGTGMGLLGLCAVLLALPGAWGDCQAVPRFSFAEPRNPTTNTSYPVGTQVPYRCRPGYVGVSGKSFLVTCLPNNTWAWDPDFCIGKSCPEPDIENGKFHYSTDLRFGATINFTCNFGYRLVGRPSAQCVLANNDVTWDHVPFCEIIPCEPPPEIVNGQFSSAQTEYVFGLAVTYTCDDGFSLIGSSTIYCTADAESNGIWSGPAPECKVVRCENPVVENGKKLTGFVEQYTYGDTVAFECLPGYFMNGSHTAKCDADSNWNPPLPKCERRYCGRPPSIPFAELVGTVSSSSPAGTTLEYRCNPGYATGDGTSLEVTCLGNTSWSVSSKSCTRQQCTPPLIENGFVKAEDFLFGATVEFSCREGYKLQGSSSAQCVASGNGVRWDVSLPTCKGYCGRPPSIPFAELVGTVSSSSPAGTTLEYRCNPGYATGDGTSLEVTCLGNTSWSVSSKSCTRQQCTPPLIENGFVKAEDFLFGATVEFSCREGYKLQGSSSAQCVASGNGVRWDVSLPTCKSYCGRPPSIPFAELVGTVSSSSPAGTTLEYRCNPGYATGDGTSLEVTCLGNTSWSVSSKSCTRQQCTPPVIKNGFVKAEDFLFGATVEFSCREGYKLQGSSSAQCVASENGVHWNVSLPTCKGGATTIIVGILPLLLALLVMSF
ncbi:complement receptor type 1-like isoform X2 [Anas acuta]|uniref:complement receptor type 1-like isoform X2 n=1 Tax=Anas acuta TaxID=28680 RepID=UPI0035C8B246